MNFKQQAGIAAANLVQSGMGVGLGTGSTVFFALERLAERQKTENLKFFGVSTSFSTTLLCRKMGIELKDCSSISHLDLAIDGADEIDPNLNLIKGRGAAHLLEKIVASLASKLVIVADSAKKVKNLGEKFPVPLEIMPAALGLTEARIKSLGGTLEIRMAGASKDGPVISDSGNIIADAKLGLIKDPVALCKELDYIPGLAGHGLFIGLAKEAFIAGEAGVECIVSNASIIL
ncbi:MAG: ribose-5-phosphate isomerase RpiA [Fibromonadaceae bacterium]|jgi:ribose 5-phosphate isomerase A|nr:ribose-5-phosphate isomerase RpiA [Fibromonadaceae bacterium]